MIISLIARYPLIGGSRLITALVVLQRRILVSLRVPHTRVVMRELKPRTVLVLESGIAGPAPHLPFTPATRIWMQANIFGTSLKEIHNNKSRLLHRLFWFSNPTPEWWPALRITLHILCLASAHWKAILLPSRISPRKPKLSTLPNVC